ncbi:MAG: hypothetical protein JW768_01790, partial [Chitinispirillaceae bacterium]|nr:hypothetical protein [Chitinispirillaceae bacterium]
MNRTIAFGLIIAFGAKLHAQTINLHGRVSNSAGQPVANAVVELAKQGVKDTTGSDGAYSIVKPNVSIRPISATVTENMRLEKG